MFPLVYLLYKYNKLYPHVDHLARSIIELISSSTCYGLYSIQYLNIVNLNIII